MTHHQIAKNSSGFWAVNKKTWGAEESDLVTFVERFQGSVDGWPVRLATFVPVAGGGDGGGGGGGGGGGYPKWLHGTMSKDDSNSLVEGQEDGTYFVFERPKDSEYVLVVVYRGKPSHHMMRRTDTGTWSINNKAIGGSHKSVFDAITALQKPGVAGWPVPLSNPRPIKANAKQPSRSIGGGGGGKDDDDAAAPPPRPTKASSSSGSSGGDEAKKARQPSKIMKSAPTWLHGCIGKEAAEELVKSHGGGDGTFLIWERSKTEYAMTIIYRGNPTHHLIRKDTESKEYMVNKLKCSGVKNLFKLVDKLSGAPSKAWPVQLKDGVAVPAGGKKPENKFWERMSTRKKSTKKPKQEEKAASTVSTSTESNEVSAAAAAAAGTGFPAWLHGELSKPEAERLVMGGDGSDGTYLVWERPSAPAAYALTVVYKGKPSHHAISKGSNGIFAVNKKPFVTGEAAKSLFGVVTALQGKVKGWPVPLATAIAVPAGGKKPTHAVAGGSGGKEANDNADAVAPPPKPAKSTNKSIAGTTEEDSSTDNGHIKKDIGGVTETTSSSDKTAIKTISGATTSSSSADASGGSGGAPVWLHGEITKEEAASKVMASGGVDGTYLVWLKSPPSTYALTVVYKGKASHHLVAKSSGSDAWTINKKAYGATHKEFKPLIEMLQSPVKGWPVVLSAPIAVNGGAANGNDAQAPVPQAEDPPVPPVPARKAPSTSRAGSPGWLHGNLGKNDAQAKVMASGGVDGTYLVWSKNPPKQYVLTVVFRGKASHHLMAKPDSSSTWTINKKQYDSSHDELEAFVKMFQAPVKGWPVPLSSPVLVEGASIESTSSEASRESDSSSPPPTAVKSVTLGDASASIKEEEEEGGGEEAPPPPPRKTQAEKAANESAKNEEMGGIDAHAAAEGLRPIGEATVKTDLQTMGSALDALLSGAVDKGGTGSKNPSWLHGKLSKTTAQELVSAGDRKDGTFLVWERDTSPNEYGLTVMFHNKPTHHLLTKDGEHNHWLVNKKSYGGTKHAKLGALIDALASHVKGWPVPLIHPVSIPTDGGKLPQTFVEGHEETAAEDAVAYVAGKGSPPGAKGKGAQQRSGLLGRPGQFEGTEDGDTRTATITKDAKGFGFKFDTMKKTGSYLSLVKPGSVSAKSGAMVTGQKIISINGTEIAGFKKVDISELIRSTDTLTLELVQDFAGYSERRVKKKLKDAAGNPQIVTATFAPRKGDFTLVGGGDASTPIWVHSVVDRSTAADTGYFAKGMRILMINGGELPEAMTTDECIGKICHGATVELKMNFSGKNYQRYLKDVEKAGNAVASSSTSASASAGAKGKASSAGRQSSAAAEGTWMQPPSEPNELRRYLSTRPSIYYSLERDSGTEWGLEWSTAGGKLTVAAVVPESAASYYELYEGDVVLEINNTDSVHLDVAGAKRLAGANDYLELLVARASVGGLTMQAQGQLRRTPINAEAAHGVGAARHSIMFDMRFVIGGDGPRYAEEYHFPASGFYDDE